MIIAPRASDQLPWSVDIALTGDCMAATATLTPVLLVLLALTCGGLAQQFPPNPSARGASGAPAPGPANRFDNIYDYLNSSPQFSDLIKLVEAAPSSADLLSVLDSQCGGVNSTSITLLAPTNTGINNSLKAIQPPQTLNNLLKNSKAVLQILMYHILPTPIPSAALVGGNSFNSLLQNANNQPVSWAVQNRPGQGRVIQGGTNSAPLQNSGVSVCTANPSIVYTLGGLLLPSTVAGAVPPSSSDASST
ncbi:hypothetical protein WJX73_005641 [Symbiochloris irregularis]|uniref:FAS1 domain-containing protein n=1 Tax=Symbiochloris irregularis TaxID=706552 RepID=A0AAW1P2D7_9CHLO